MQTFEISSAQIAVNYDRLNCIGNLAASPEAGFLRAAYSDLETEAIRFIESRATAAGFAARYDALGNLTLESETGIGQYVEVASHLDTVPFGGNFDGAAGVVAGLEAVLAIKGSSSPRSKGLRLRVWRSEESSTFQVALAGSRAACGLLKPAVLHNRFQGRTLAEAIESQGYDPNVIREGRRTIEQPELDSIAAHLELHIEQGNYLERSGIDIGVITSIRGPSRHRITLQGEFDHSGATPMGKAFRKDANLALGYMLVRLDELANAALGAGRDLVQTVGIINSERDLNEPDGEVYRNSGPKVSGYCYFSFEVRSVETAWRDQYVESALELIRQTGNEFGVTVSIQLLGAVPAIEGLDLKIQQTLVESSDALRLSYALMPSGALHDAATISAERTSAGLHVPVGMVFIPCRGGKSHCPEEFSTMEQIAKGASVVATAMANLAA